MYALDFYRQQEPASDPHELAHLYAELPTSLPDLCGQIKQLLLHPAQFSQHRGKLAPGARSEDSRFLTVHEMLVGLQNRHAVPLTSPRSPNKRLYLTCRYHALLLVSILRQRQIPARVRVGFASYVANQAGKFIDHWIVEVWSEDEQRWLLVDPDTQRIDMPAAEFHFAGAVWQQARQHLVNPLHYGLGRVWGWGFLQANLCHDFSACLRDTHTYWEGPPLFHANPRRLKKAQSTLLDKMADLLQQPDDNLAPMQALHLTTPELQGSQLANWAPRELLLHTMLKSTPSS